MANVDKCVREAELAICENMTNHINNILAISDNERTKCFRNKNHNDIENILINFKTYIQEKLILINYQKITHQQQDLGKQML